jgi:hypothetical protein
VCALVAQGCPAGGSLGWRLVHHRSQAQADTCTGSRGEPWYGQATLQLCNLWHILLPNAKMRRVELYAVPALEHVEHRNVKCRLQGTSSHMSVLHTLERRANPW